MPNRLPRLFIGATVAGTLALAGTLAAAPAPAVDHTAPVGKQAAAWELIFNDEFNTPAPTHPDPNLWAHRNSPAAEQTTCKRDGENGKNNSRNRNRSNNSVAVVAGGYLKLLVKKRVCKRGENKGILLYKSGHIGIAGVGQWHMTPNFRWSMSARIKFPKSSGNHAAMWTRSGSGTQPQEVDVAESFGVRAGCPLWTNYYPVYPKNDAAKQVCLSKKTTRAKRPWRSFHFYKMVWQPGQWTRIYIDNRKVHEFGPAHTPTLTQMGILSNLVNDPPKGQRNRHIRPSDASSTMTVDWIRIYRKPL